MALHPLPVGLSRCIPECFLSEVSGPCNANHLRLRYSMSRLNPIHKKLFGIMANKPTWFIVNFEAL